MLVSVANAQTDSHDHDHAPLHAPQGAGAHEGHAHPGVGLAHPIVTESPLPETKLRLKYHFADGDEGIEHEAEVEAEYAFTQNFSVEAIVPYVFVNPNEGDAENGLGDSILSFKLASYEWVDHHVLPAIGLEIILPTGDEEKGIGSDHVIELEPFVRVGYWNGPFEFIATAGVGIPFNQTDEEDAEEDFEVVYNLSTLYHVGPNLQALIELHGETVFGE